MKPAAWLYGSVKTHNCASPDIITTEKLKFRLILGQTGTYTYNAAQVTAEHLKPLTDDENPYIIHNTQEFSSIIKAEPPLETDEEYVSYNAESMFTNIPVRETINYILAEIYDHQKLKPMCCKLIFKGLLLKLTTESTFIFNIKYYKQTNGCTMERPLPVVFSNIYMTKLEKDAILPPRKPKLYKRFVGDTFKRRKTNTPDHLLEFLNNYHSNIKLTYEINPEKFLDTKICYNNSSIITKVHRGVTKLTLQWSSGIPKRYKRNTVHGDLCRAERISSNFNNKKY